jgi:phage terminase small subunit
MSTTPAFDALDVQHQRFLAAYMANGQNGTAAYQHAYPDCSADSAPAAASRLLSTVKVSAALAELKAQLAERLKVTPQRIIGEYAAIAFARMGNFVAWGPSGVTLLDDARSTTPTRRRCPRSARP